MQTAGASMERLLPLPLLLWGKKVDNPISGQPNLEGTPSQIQVLETFLNLRPQTQEFEAIDTDTIVDEKTQSSDKYYFFFIVILFCFVLFLNLANYPKKASYTNLYNTLNISQY